MPIPRYECPTTGCTTVFRAESSIRLHVKETHEACSCGWAGISWNGHMAQVQRRIDGGHIDPPEYPHEPIAMSFDREHGVWRRVSSL